MNLSFREVTAQDKSIEQGYHVNIEDKTLKNSNYRKVLFTSPKMQLVLMSLKAGEDIGMETHKRGAQFIRIESGTGKAILNGKNYSLKDGSSLVIPAGIKHNITNTGDVEMKLYTVYTPPQHEDGLVAKTKKQAEEME